MRAGCAGGWGSGIRHSDHCGSTERYRASAQRSRPERLKDIPGTLFLAGGAPVQFKGAPAAAIGVAGAPSGDLDEQFAQAGVAALAK
ncbi:heme-binding protein [Kitasatospora aureofaciens]|uniref:heme-binding protein n=1 Tax=Kitasatospora aureofaciens TaxID=1894 RepID=UPI0027E1C206|nr:heme-binding protein [Kitasatospora aureofaciens]